MFFLRLTFKVSHARVRRKPASSIEEARFERTRHMRNRDPVPRVGSDGWLALFFADDIGSESEDQHENTGQASAE